ncbi:MAG: cyanase [Desulfovibrio sp.]|jgi:cyanate lyase|nr:cyanase [Desulfovibrio sp.]
MATKLTKDQVRELILSAKEEKGLTWDQIGEKLGRTSVGAAGICYGYGQVDAQEADAIVNLFSLPAEAKKPLMEAPHRMPVQPWPPTDPFIYRFYEVVMLYGPVWKDVCHEQFGDGIISAIDCFFDIEKVIDEHGVPRAKFVFQGKWLTYQKY